MPFRAELAELGEDASPEGLIPSLRYAEGKLFRTGAPAL